MAFAETGFIWMNGKMVPWKDANIHICSHVIHYGSCLFEGIRAYSVGGRTGIFRLGDHIQRLINSCKIYRTEIPYSKEEVMNACVDTVRENSFKSCYIRPVVYRGYGTLGVNPLPCPVDTAIIVWEWGKYLGPEAIEKGVDVCVSNWQRVSPNTLPALAKAAANYMNSQLIKMEAIVNGYVEGIALDHQGFVSEGSGENIFIVRDGVICTPGTAHSILPGITRDCIIQLAEDLGIPLIQRSITHAELYISDEVFFTGTAAEITPIRTVDKVTVGKGSRGPITERLQQEFFGIISGEIPDRHNWFTWIS